MSMTSKDLKDYKPDQKSQDAIWAHSANLSSLSLIIEEIDEGSIDENYEICVTKKEEAGLFIGNGNIGLGLFLKGKVTAMFTTDIGSSFNPGWDERRFFNESDKEYLVEKLEDLKPQNNDYTESFLIPTEVVGIWMDKSHWENIQSPKKWKWFWNRFGGVENRFPITII